jgi:hypothetical protein
MAICNTSSEDRAIPILIRFVVVPVISLIRPWIDDVNAAVVKVFRIARGDACSSRTSHGDNHGIELADGFTCSSFRGSNIGEYISRFAVETQDLIGEVFIKNFHRGIPQSSSTLAVGEYSKTVENFGASYRSDEQGRARLIR